MKMKAVYIVNDLKVAKILVDPMRRAILDLLRQRPMTQAQLAHELGLTGASLNYHIKKLRSKKLVVVAKREVEEHSIMQIFFSSIAYLFVYDLEEGLIEDRIAFEVASSTDFPSKDNGYDLVAFF